MSHIHVYYSLEIYILVPKGKIAGPYFSPILVELCYFIFLNSKINCVHYTSETF